LAVLTGLVLNSVAFLLLFFASLLECWFATRNVKWDSPSCSNRPKPAQPHDVPAKSASESNRPNPAQPDDVSATSASESQGTATEPEQLHLNSKDKDGEEEDRKRKLKKAEEILRTVHSLSILHDNFARFNEWADQSLGLETPGNSAVASHRNPIEEYLASKDTDGVDVEQACSDNGKP
jgi:hypothetical protein